MPNYATMLTPNIVKSFPQETDYIYVPTGNTFPTFIDLKPDVFEVDDQLSVRSCTANAATSVPEDMLKKDGRGVSLSRLFNYWISRNTILEQPGINGSTMRASIRAIKHFGVCREMLWPYTIPSVDIKPSDEAFAEAISRRIQRYEIIDTRLPNPLPPINGLSEEDWRELIFMIVNERVIKQMKSALNERLQVAFSCNLGQQWYGLMGSWREHVYVRPGVNNPIVGGHAMVVIGYDDSCKRFLIENSWGSTWGDGGFGGMPYDSFAYSLLEGFIVRGFDGIYINDPLQAEWDWIQKLYLGYYQRHADLGGMLYWRDRLVKEGFPAIVEAFMTSAEAQVLYYENKMKEANLMTRRNFKEVTKGY